MPLAQYIQKLKEQAGLSQSELARKAGVPVRSVQNWEQGHRLPRAQALLPLADALGVPVDKLIKSMSWRQPGQAAAGEEESQEEMKFVNVSGMKSNAPGILYWPEGNVPCNSAT
jgi:transcriptional regulator with XRE-family HTH domain